MAVNIFGLSGSSRKQDFTNKNYVDSKFIILTRDLEKKLEKSDGVLTGNLNAGGNQITGLPEPFADSDACNKKYLDSKTIALTDNLQVKADKQYVDKLIMQTIDNVIKHVDAAIGKAIGNLDIITRTSVVDLVRDNLKYPTNSLDAVNQKYVQLSIVDIGKLIPIATAISDIFQKYPEDNIRNYKDDFYTRLQNVKLLINAYEESTEFHKTNIFADLSSNSFINGLNFLIVTVIENLPVNIFQELKRVLVGENLSQSPIQPGVLKRYRYFITKRANVIDPTRSDDKLQLLIYKNLLLIDLGFAYFIESLLMKLIQ